MEKSDHFISESDIHAIKAKQCEGLSETGSSELNESGKHSEELGGEHCRTGQEPARRKEIKKVLGKAVGQKEVSDQPNHLRRGGEDRGQPAGQVQFKKMEPCRHC